MERNYCCTITYYSNKVPIGRPQIIGLYFSPCLILWLALFWPSCSIIFHSVCHTHDVHYCVAVYSSYIAYVWNLKPRQWVHHSSSGCPKWFPINSPPGSAAVTKKRLTSITQVTKIEITNCLCHLSVKSTVLFWWLLFGHDMLCLRSLCSKSRTFKCGMLREITLCINPQSPN